VLAEGTPSEDAEALLSARLRGGSQHAKATLTARLQSHSAERLSRGAPGSPRLEALLAVRAAEKAALLPLPWLSPRTSPLVAVAAHAQPSLSQLEGCIRLGRRCLPPPPPFANGLYHGEPEPPRAPFFPRSTCGVRSQSLRTSDRYEDRNIHGWPSTNLVLYSHKPELTGNLLGASCDASNTPRAQAQWHPPPRRSQVVQEKPRSRSVQNSDPFAALSSCASFQAAVSKGRSETPRNGARSVRASPVSSCRSCSARICGAGCWAAIRAHSRSPSRFSISGRLLGQQPRHVQRSASPAVRPSCATSPAEGMFSPRGSALDKGCSPPARQLDTPSRNSGPRPPFQAMSAVGGPVKATRSFLGAPGAPVESPSAQLCFALSGSSAPRSSRMASPSPSPRVAHQMRAALSINSNGQQPVCAALPASNEGSPDRWRPRSTHCSEQRTPSTLLRRPFLFTDEVPSRRPLTLQELIL